MRYEAREVRNSIISNLETVGLSQKSIGAAVNLSQQMVCKLMQKKSLGLPMCQKHKGAQSRLNPEQLSKLPEFLSRGSEHYDFSGDYWTHKRVQYVIEKEYGIIYEVKQVGRILGKIGWTRQKPQKKDVKQDLAQVQKWKTSTFPALKKSHR